MKYYLKIRNTLMGSDGFTLIEIMVSICILAFGLLALGGLQMSAIRGNNQAIRHTMALALVENKIEELKNTVYDDIPSGSETEKNLGFNQAFTRTTVVENDMPIQGTKTVTVTIAWTSDRSHAIEVKTIISRGGI
jgi:type IV pilus assembly protein PilV